MGTEKNNRKKLQKKNECLNSDRGEYVSNQIRLVVGLGNPGKEHVGTRHNFGEYFVRLLAAHFNCSNLSKNEKFFAAISRVSIHDRELHLLAPSTFMNESGKSVSAYNDFFKIIPEEILVVHDDLDIPTGTARLKIGGGHGGHNGLRSIISSLGNNNGFCRLRIGIGHPGSSRNVSNYVLSQPTKDEKEKILLACRNALNFVPLFVEGNFSQAMAELNGITSAPENSAVDI